MSKPQQNSLNRREPACVASSVLGRMATSSPLHIKLATPTVNKPLWSSG